MSLGSYWDRLTWPQLAVILLGARRTSGCCLSWLPDAVLQKIIHMAARPRWRPTFSWSPTSTAKLPAGARLSKGRTTLSFRCAPEVELGKLPSLRLDGWGVQYIELALSFVGIGSTISIYFGDGPPSDVVCIDFEAEQYGEDEYGATTVMVTYHIKDAPASYLEAHAEASSRMIIHAEDAHGGTLDAAAAAESRWGRHVHLWNAWEEDESDESNYYEPEGSKPPSGRARVGLLLDFEAQLARLALNGRPGPLVPFSSGSPDTSGDKYQVMPTDGRSLRLGLEGWWGEDKAKQVLPDGSVRLQRVSCSVDVPARVPFELLEDLIIDHGTCVEAECDHCRYST